MDVQYTTVAIFNVNPSYVVTPAGFELAVLG